jgi:hypothetical protein
VDGIKLMVVFHEGHWKMKVGDTLSRPYNSEGEAIRAALSRAHKLGQEGFESEVIMKVMTCKYGPNGVVKTIPSQARTIR